MRALRLVRFVAGQSVRPPVSCEWQVGDDNGAYSQHLRAFDWQVLCIGFRPAGVMFNHQESFSRVELTEIITIEHVYSPRRAERNAV